MNTSTKGKKIIIHCGCHKTGTTSLQEYLFKNKKTLITNSILYPSSGMKTNAKGYRHTKLLYGKDRSQLLDNLINECREINANYVVISTEALSRPKHKNTLKRIATLFNNENYDVEGYLYVRNYFEYAIKFYREFVIKSGAKEDFKSFVIKNKAILNYLRISKYLKESLSKIRFIKYDSSKDIVSCFLHDTKLPLHFDKKIKKFQVNKGRGFISTEIYRQLNVTGIKGRDLKSLSNYIEEKYFRSDKKRKLYSNGVEELSVLRVPNNKYLKDLSATMDWDNEQIEMLYKNNMKNLNQELSKELQDDVNNCLQKENIF